MSMRSMSNNKMDEQDEDEGARRRWRSKKKMEEQDEDEEVKRRFFFFLRLIGDSYGTAARDGSCVRQCSMFTSPHCNCVEYTRWQCGERPGL